MNLICYVQSVFRSCCMRLAAAINQSCVSMATALVLPSESTSSSSTVAVASYGTVVEL